MIPRDPEFPEEPNEPSKSNQPPASKAARPSGKASTMRSRDKTPPPPRDATMKAKANRQRNAGPTVAGRDIQKWERVQAVLKTRLGADAFASWFGRCRLESLEGRQLVLSVPTKFLKNWLRSHYFDMLNEEWLKQVPDLLRIDIVVRSAVRSENSDKGGIDQSAIREDTTAKSEINPFLRAGTEAVPQRSGMASSASGTAAGPRLTDANVGATGSPLDPNFTFATFVEGSSNRMACAAAKSVAEADGGALRFNPLFIHASVGLGKTHLLQAIAWAAAERDSRVKILYLTAEYFMWKFASAIRDSSALSFKESLRDIDLLLIDDMQFLQGKSIQQEFCHLLNALIDSAKQVVVAADRPPAQLESLDARVRSRLQGGVALEIKFPEIEMRREILSQRLSDAQREDPNLDIPDHVLDYVAQKVSSSGRDLEGAFNQLLIQHRFSEGPVDISVIEKMVGHLVQSGEQRRVRIEDIQKVAARHYNVTKNDLLSNRRTRVIVRPRQIAMYLSKMLTPRSLPEIGRRFGGRDHTTVLHAVRKIEQLLAEDPKLGQEIELLKRLVHEMGQ